MKIHFLRHGQRDHSFGDVPLNSQGHSQAQMLAQDSQLQNVQTILSSPKKRALMTVQPLSQKLQINVVCDPDLDQMESSQSEQAFQRRVESYLKKIEDGFASGDILICSHSDWLTLATSLLAQDNIHIHPQLFDCAAYKSFSLEDGQWIAI